MWRGIVSATRGNHGQSLALAERRRAARSSHHRSAPARQCRREKKAGPMRALPVAEADRATGEDFEPAPQPPLPQARPKSAVTKMVSPVVSCPISSRAWRAIALQTSSRAAPYLHTVLCPDGPSAFRHCGLIAPREPGWGLDTQIVGVVSENGMPMPAHSRRGEIIATENLPAPSRRHGHTPARFPDAFAIIRAGACAHFVRVSDSGSRQEAIRYSITRIRTTWPKGDRPPRPLAALAREIRNGDAASRGRARRRDFLWAAAICDCVALAARVLAGETPEPAPEARQQSRSGVAAPLAVGLYVFGRIIPVLGRCPRGLEPRSRSER